MKIRCAICDTTYNSSALSDICPMCRKIIKRSKKDFETETLINQPSTEFIDTSVADRFSREYFE